jgi:hypothetical protein
MWQQKHLAFCLVCLVAVAVQLNAQGVDCSPPLTGAYIWGVGNTVSLAPAAGWENACAPCAISDGIAYWNTPSSPCFGFGIPTMAEGFDPYADIFVDVSFRTGLSTGVDGTCGDFHWTETSDGHVATGGIVIFEFDRDGNRVSHIQTKSLMKLDICWVCITRLTHLATGGSWVNGPTEERGLSLPTIVTTLIHGGKRD